MKYSEFLTVTGLTHDQVKDFSQCVPLAAGYDNYHIVVNYLRLQLAKAVLRINPPKEAERYRKEVKKKFPYVGEEYKEGLVEIKIANKLFDYDCAVFEVFRQASELWDKGEDCQSLEYIYQLECL